VFQRRKRAIIGVNAHLPGFIEPALASPIEKGAVWQPLDLQVHLASDAINPSRPQLDPSIQKGRA
jgi:hypothetical protein